MRCLRHLKLKIVDFSKKIEIDSLSNILINFIFWTKKWNFGSLWNSTKMKWGWLFSLVFYGIHCFVKCQAMEFSRTKWSSMIYGLTSRSRCAISINANAKVVRVSTPLMKKLLCSFQNCFWVEFGMMEKPQGVLCGFCLSWPLSTADDHYYYHYIHFLGGY